MEGGDPYPRLSYHFSRSRTNYNTDKTLVLLPRQSLDHYDRDKVVPEIVHSRLVLMYWANAEPTGTIGFGSCLVIDTTVLRGSSLSFSHGGVAFTN